MSERTDKIVNVKHAYDYVKSSNLRKTSTKCHIYAKILKDYNKTVNIT